MTNTLLKLNFCNVKVRDEDIEDLAKSCKRLEYLNLIDTYVTHYSVPVIIRTWFDTLVDLSLPEEIGIRLGLYVKETIEEDLRSLAITIQSMPKLQYLHIGDFYGNLNPMLYKECIREENIHKEKLRQLLPNLGINMDPIFDNQYPGDLQHWFSVKNRNLKSAGFQFSR